MIAVAVPPFHEFRADVLGVTGESRWAQVALAKASDALPLDAREREWFETYTQRPYTQQLFRQWMYLFGRQSGKTELSADRLVYEGVGASLRGERGVACVGVAQDSRSATAVLFGYVKRRFDEPMLRALVVSETANSITLKGGVVIVVLPCKPEALRGYRIKCIVLDEFCHYRNSENIALDREVWRAALPALLTTAGKMFLVSSLYTADGLGFDLHERGYGKPDSDICVVKAPGLALNPQLDEEFMRQIRDADPEGARAELDSEFLTNRSALIDPETLIGAVDAGVTVRSRSGRDHVAFMDWATGTKAGNDAATIAIAHRTREGKAVLDAVQAWPPPFSPSQVAIEASALCTRYGVSVVTGDRFAQGFSDEALRRAGLTYRHSDMDKSALYVAFAAGVNAGEVRLLDSPDLLREIRGLERRRTPTRDKVDHRPGAHDDRANAAAGVIAQLLRVQRGGAAGADVWWLY